MVNHLILMTRRTRCVSLIPPIQVLSNNTLPQIVPFAPIMTSSVQLYVYDLSNGMARQLSQQLTGRQIDGIWYEYSNGIRHQRRSNVILGIPQWFALEKKYSMGKGST